MIGYDNIGKKEFPVLERIFNYLEKEDDENKDLIDFVFSKKNNKHEVLLLDGECTLYPPNITMYFKNAPLKTSKILIKNIKEFIKFGCLRMKEILCNTYVRKNDLIYVSLTKKLEDNISKEVKQKVSNTILNSKRVKKLLDNIEYLNKKYDEIYILTDNPTKTIRDVFKPYGIETMRKNSKRIDIIKEKMSDVNFTLLTDGVNDLRFYEVGINVIPVKQISFTNRIGVNQLSNAKPFKKCLEELLE